MDTSRGTDRVSYEAELWKHVSRLAVYSCAFFAVGCALALPGAALGYLAENVGGKEADLGILFTMRGAAYATASLLGGVIGEMLNAFEFGTHLIMSISMSMAALGMWAASRSESVSGLGLSLTGTSIAMGALDTVGNIATLRSCERVRRGAAAALSVVHASFGIGCVAAPALIRHVFEQSIVAEQSAFNACAILSAGCALMLCMVPSVSFRTSKPLQQVPHDSTKSVSNACCIGSGRDPSTRGLTAFAASLLIFTYVGIEQGTGALLSTWAYRSLKRRRRRAYDLTLTFWFAMVFGRLLAGVSVPDDFRADFLVVVATSVSTGSGVALAMTNEHTVTNLSLSIIVFCLGCAYGPIYPLAFARLEARCGGGLSATFGGVVVAMGGLGEMSLPLLMFRAWHTFGALAFGASIGALSLICVLCWGVVLQTTSTSYLEILRSQSRLGARSPCSVKRGWEEGRNVEYAPLGNHLGHTVEFEMEDSGDEDDLSRDRRRSDSDSSLL